MEYAKQRMSMHFGQRPLFGRIGCVGAVALAWLVAVLVYAR